MSTYNGGNMDSAPEYSYGYGPGGPSHGQDHGHGHSHRHASGQGHSHGASSHRHGPSQGHSKRERGEKGQHLHGESASYDNIPGYAPSEGHTVYDNQNGHQYSDDTKDRGVADYFYKKPDPSYSGTYGTDYHPEISKTKVFTATAAVVALFYGVSKYRAKLKEKEKRKRHGKHTHRGQDDYTTNGSEYPYDDSHSRY
ncbi:hypothetical protein GGF42_000618 [Coemansia sp. RSA 2424]|nr:hypothetical protein GGF42_000618 [Coemansia sp. RSA 2424]